MAKVKQIEEITINDILGRLQNGKVSEARAMLLQLRDETSLRDELVEDCDGFNLSDGYCIEATFLGDWDVSGGGELVRGGFDTPEAAFAWLKAELPE